MNIYLDTEFHEYKKDGVDTIELISIGMTYENQAFYVISKEFDVDAAWENKWLRENVLIPIYKQQINKFSPAATFVDEEITFAPVRDVFLAEGLTRAEIAEKVLKWINDRPKTILTTTTNNVKGEKQMTQKFDQSRPVFHAYYGDYDWVVFCWIFGRMIDLPDGFPMYCRDLKQMFDEAIEEKKVTQDGFIKFEKEMRYLKNHPLYPNNANSHNALADAIWNQKFHDFIKLYKDDKLAEYDEVVAETGPVTDTFDEGWFAGSVEEFEGGTPGDGEVNTDSTVD